MEALLQKLVDAANLIVAWIKGEETYSNRFFIPIDTALTKAEVAFGPTKYVKFMNWPAALGSIEVRLRKDDPDAFDVLLHGSVFRFPQGVSKLYISTDVNVTGGTLDILTGNVELEPVQSYGAGGVMAAGNGIYPVWTKETGGATLDAGTVTHSTLGVTNASQTALAANTGRKYALFTNDSANVIYLYLGATAVANTGIRLEANGGWHKITGENAYVGIVTAIAAVAGPSNLLVEQGT